MNLRVVSITLLSVMAFCLNFAGPGAAAAASNTLQVSGGVLLRNGAPFIVKGVQIDAFVDPPVMLRGWRLKAYRIFGEAELRAAKDRWNANTIRFQLSQPGLDPQNPMYSAQYISEMQKAVALAESLGFVIIASVQDEANPGYVGMPTDATLRADRTLGMLFGHDGDVMLDLYNEPKLKALVWPGDVVRTDNWETWAHGGTYNGSAIVGMQTIVNDLRASGAKNVLLLEGLVGAGILAGIPPITDPLNNYAFAVHPFLHGRNASPQNWTKDFGFLVDQHKLLIADAWSAPTVNGPGDKWCEDASSLALPGQLLDYLKQRRIGVVGWAFDKTGTIVNDFNGTPTTLAGKQCNDPDGGPGELMVQLFHEEP